MIKTTLATEVFIIAKTKAIKLKDIAKPPNIADVPEVLKTVITFFL